MDLDSVKTFLAAADLGQFQTAAADLGVTQQAVSKRIAKLERELGVSLFSRTARGTQLSVDGQAFLPHAREVAQAAERAIAAVRPGCRALRVDVLNRRIAPSVLLYEFHRANPDVMLDIVTLPGANIETAVDAIRAGVIDASFRAVLDEELTRAPEIASELAFESRLEVLIGPRHPLAAAKEIHPIDLREYRIWIPGITAGTEWAKFYSQLSEEFGLTIDNIGPHFGDEALLQEIADSSTLATFVGERDRYLWPAHYDLHRIPLSKPSLAYPHSLIWRRDNTHSGIAALRHYFRSIQTEPNAPV